MGTPKGSPPEEAQRPRLRPFMRLMFMRPSAVRLFSADCRHFLAHRLMLRLAHFPEKLWKTGEIAETRAFSCLLALDLLPSGDESFSRRRICVHLWLEWQ